MADTHDADELKRFGYAQQLKRSMGPLSSFALSFSVISVLTGGVTLYGHGLKYGGPLEMTLGWPLVSVMTLFVALSLAELASAFPTAGALYHWASILGGRGFGFFTAWFNVIGQFAITATIDYGLAEFLAPSLHIEPSRLNLLLIFTAVIISHGLINHLGVRLVAALNIISAWYHVAGVLLVIGCIALFAPAVDAHVLTQTFTIHQGSYWYGFLLGLLQAGWTFTGYDASAHVTEETVDAANNAPKGIVGSVVVSAIAGYAMLLSVTLLVRTDELPRLVTESNPFLFLMSSRLGHWGTVVSWCTMGAMWFCGLSSMTSNSRMLFAFARDGGFPASKYVSLVSTTFQTPHVAIWVSAAAALAVALFADLYSVMAALSTIALYASYGLPIFLGMVARAEGRWKKRGPWHLGRWSTLVNVIAIEWILAMSVLFVQPPNQLAGVAMLGLTLLLASAWLIRLRHTFTGPPVPSIEQLEAGTSRPLAHLDRIVQ